jgi:hypothetical protein
LAPGGALRYAWHARRRENKDGAKMSTTPQHLSILGEIERECLPGLVRVLREEGLGRTVATKGRKRGRAITNFACGRSSCPSRNRRAEPLEERVREFAVRLVEDPEALRE